MGPDVDSVMTDARLDGAASAVERLVGLHGGAGMKEVRISWRIGAKTGNGLWFPDADSQSLQTLVTCLNRRFGAGTHWIEQRLA